MLLLITPANSGSTAMADYLAQVSGAVGLRRNYEGQWLVPGLHGDRRWSPELPIDVDSIRLVWTNRLASLVESEGHFGYFIEKSPPNMVRYRAIRDLFPHTRVVCNNRHPLAVVSSMGYRYNNFDEATSTERARACAQLAATWMTRSWLIRHIHETEAYPVVTYEEFCDDPARAVRAFGFEVDGADRHLVVSVKDYPDQGLQNMNSWQVERLTAAERDIVAEGLSGDPDLLRFFGYEDVLKGA